MGNDILVYCKFIELASGRNRNALSEPKWNFVDYVRLYYVLNPEFLVSSLCFFYSFFLFITYNLHALKSWLISIDS